MVTTLQIPKRSVRNLQYCTDGGTVVQTNYLIINEACLTPVIETLNQKELLDNKKLACAVCQETLNKNNIRAIVPRKEDTDFLCTKVHCIDEYFYGRKQ